MSGNSRLSRDTLVVRSKYAFSQEVDDDVVILHVNRGHYFGAEIVGQHIWRLLETPVRISAICDDIMANFKEVDRRTCEQDTLEFLEELRAADLLDIVEA